VHRLLDCLQLVHQLVVDVQASSGVDDDRVEAFRSGLGERSGGARNGVHRLGCVHAHAGLFAND